MTLAQIITSIILAIWPGLFAGAFWFFQIPWRQREALAQFAPVAARIMQQNATLNQDAQMQLALVFMTEAFAAARLPNFPENIVRAAIQAQLAQ